MSAHRAAIIGCGRIGSEFADDPRIHDVYTHAGAYAACPDTELVAVCDTDPARLERCAQRWGVSARFTDPLQLLAEARPEVLSICTPDATHAELLHAALAAPGLRAVLAEKPLAQDLMEARELVALAAERGVVLAVNYSRRHDARHVWLRDLLRAGALGSLQTVSGWHAGGLVHNGTHWLDLLRFLAGEVHRVWGFDPHREPGPDPALEARLELRGGATAFLHAGDADAFSLFEMDLIGSAGRVRVADSGHRFEVYRVADSPFYSGYRTLGLQEVFTDGLRDVLLGAVQDLVRCLREGGAPRCTGADGVAALELALAIRASARSGQPATLPASAT